MASPSDKTILQELKTQAWILGGLIGLLWGIQLINAELFNGRLAHYGIRPRQLNGLQGILWAPLLHGSASHLLANTIPLLTLGWLIMLQETEDFLTVTIITAFVSGLGTWLVGASTSIHIGASGIVFGYFGYLLLRGYFERSATSIALSFMVIMLYGGLIWGVLPTQQGISWEGHLFGFIGGGLAARLLAKRRSPR
ncbi:MAG: rhomboid family intramembrane serine protease [Leptolyngbya sp. SIO1E4]|nr:rhomboid family intramembrane serine protease [Leptolyngbya sp. SIO1E4]